MQSTQSLRRLINRKNSLIAVVCLAVVLILSLNTIATELAAARLDAMLQDSGDVGRQMSVSSPAVRILSSSPEVSLSQFSWTSEEGTTVNVSNVSLFFSWWSIASLSISPSDGYIGKLKIKVPLGGNETSENMSYPDSIKAIEESLSLLIANFELVGNLAIQDIDVEFEDADGNTLLLAGSGSIEKQESQISMTGVLKVLGQAKAVPATAATLDLDVKWKSPVGVTLPGHYKLSFNDRIHYATLESDLILSVPLLGSHGAAEIDYNGSGELPIISRYIKTGNRKNNLDVSLSMSDGQLKLDRFTVNYQDSDIAVTGFAQFEEEKITVTSDIESESLHLVTSSGEPNQESTTTDQTTIFPEWLDAKVNYFIREFTYGPVYANDISIQFTGNEESLSLKAESDQVMEGIFRVDSSLQHHANDTLSGSMYVGMQSIEVDRLSAMEDNRSMVRGQVSGELDIAFSDVSASSVADAIYGDGYLLVEKGDIDGLLVEGAGLNIQDSVKLLFSDQPKHYEILCGYMDVSIENGIADLTHFFVDTPDTLFIADGNVNLTESMLNIRLTPKPKDTSFLSLNSRINISGPISSPKIRPGRKFYGKLAIGALLAGLVTPAGFVLPLIRFGDSAASAGCEQMQLP